MRLWQDLNAVERNQTYSRPACSEDRSRREGGFWISTRLAEARLESPLVAKEVPTGSGAPHTADEFALDSPLSFLSPWNDSMRRGYYRGEFSLEEDVAALVFYF